MSREDASALLDEYFSLGVAEGREGRDHDTPAGDAQRVRSALEAALSSPAPSIDAEAVRAVAVEIVDMIRGYTMEFSSHPAAHADEYDMVETHLNAALSPDTAARMEAEREDADSLIDQLKGRLSWCVDTGRVKDADLYRRAVAALEREG